MATNEWDAFADSWDSNDLTSLYADRAHAALTDIITLRDLRVLDFGCGTGLLTEKMSPNAEHIVALDGSVKMVERLKQKALPNVSPIADFLTPEFVRSAPLLQEKFDLITASSVCAFLPDYAETLRLLRSVLKPTGIYAQWDWLLTEPDAGNGFTKVDVRQALDRAGFSEISLSQPFVIEDSNATLPVLMAVARNGES